MEMIEVRNLTKRYQDRVAVRSLSFSVKEGEILGFLGPNGAGKSTTMKMLTGFMPPSEGTVRVAGFDVFESPMEVKRRLGYLPEVPPLYLEMTVRGFLRFVAELKGVPRRSLNAEVERVAQLTDLTPELGRIIQKLSKGYRQRVGMAQALLGSPKVLVLDEPTEGLDPSQRKDVRSLIKSLAGQHTVILSTHVLSEVALTCERALVIRRGERVALDTIQAIAQAHGGPNASLEEAFIRLTQDEESGGQAGAHPGAPPPLPSPSDAPTHTPADDDRRAPEAA
jgi:ABC-2 type transport system ATP-binding protein